MFAILLLATEDCIYAIMNNGDQACTKPGEPLGIILSLIIKLFCYCIPKKVRVYILMK